MILSSQQISATNMEYGNPHTITNNTNTATGKTLFSQLIPIAKAQFYLWSMECLHREKLVLSNTSGEMRPDSGSNGLASGHCKPYTTAYVVWKPP